MLALMRPSATDGVLLVAHGTVARLSALPAFLKEIRRGRDPSADLVAEMTRRYELIGGSPLLTITHEQARALSAELQLPVQIGMRFGEHPIVEGLREAARAGIRRLVTIPLAPYSVGLYVAEAQQKLKELQTKDECAELELRGVEPWGEHPQLIEAFRAAVIQTLAGTRAVDVPVVATAHSLPMQVIKAGDSYADQVQASASALERALGLPVTLAYQSQGEGGGAWLGPTLAERLQHFAERGARAVLVVPIGFLSEHVETLYDLDHEARSQAAHLGVTLLRVPALNAHPTLIACLRDITLAVLGHAGSEHAI
jgi:ferrochelatase